MTFEKDGSYIFVQFPDIPEAITQGDSNEQAYEMAGEVLGLVLAEKAEYPVASSIEDIQKRYPDKAVALVGVDLAAYRWKYRSQTIRKNVRIPEELKDLATSENLNLSQTLTEALKEKLGVK